MPQCSCGMSLMSAFFVHFKFVSLLLNIFRSVRLLTRSYPHSHRAPYHTVVLYVAHSNVAAARVYNKVGFIGLSSDNKGLTEIESDNQVQGESALEPLVESWIELGFERSKVDLGHW